MKNTFFNLMKKGDFLSASAGRLTPPPPSLSGSTTIKNPYFLCLSLPVMVIAEEFWEVVQKHQKNAQGPTIQFLKKIIYHAELETMAWDPANFLATSAPDFFQATPAPGFFPNGSASSSWIFFFERLRLRLQGAKKNQLHLLTIG